MVPLFLESGFSVNLLTNSVHPVRGFQVSGNNLWPPDRQSAKGFRRHRSRNYELRPLRKAFPPAAILALSLQKNENACEGQMSRPFPCVDPVAVSRLLWRVATFRRRAIWMTLARSWISGPPICAPSRPPNANGVCPSTCRWRPSGRNPNSWAMPALRTALRWASFPWAAKAALTAIRRRWMAPGTNTKTRRAGAAATD